MILCINTLHEPVYVSENTFIPEGSEWTNYFIEKGNNMNEIKSVCPDESEKETGMSGILRNKM